MRSAPRNALRPHSVDHLGIHQNSNDIEASHRKASAQATDKGGVIQTYSEVGLLRRSPVFPSCSALKLALAFADCFLGVMVSADQAKGAPVILLT